MRCVYSSLRLKIGVIHWAVPYDMTVNSRCVPLWEAQWQHGEGPQWLCLGVRDWRRWNGWHPFGKRDVHFHKYPQFLAQELWYRAKVGPFLSNASTLYIAVPYRSPATLQIFLWNTPTADVCWKLGKDFIISFFVFNYIDNIFPKYVLIMVNVFKMCGSVDD